MTEALKKYTALADLHVLPPHVVVGTRATVIAKGAVVTEAELPARDIAAMLAVGHLALLTDEPAAANDAEHPEPPMAA